MKKLVPFILFTATTLHTILGISPVMAMGCGSHSDKAKVVCESGDVECEEKFSSQSSN